MKAIVHKEAEGFEGLTVENVAEPDVKPNTVKVKLKTAGMNRRDVMITKRHQPDQGPLIPGSDGSGVIAEVGEGVTNCQVGDEVVINPALGWIENSDAPPEGFEILGLPDDGTFGEYIVVNQEQVEKKPKHLSWVEAGVLPLAALTAFRVIFTRGNIQKGDTVMLPGIGSGVLTFVLKYAKAVGARVIVTSRSQEKLEKAKLLGADVAIQTNSNWNEELKGETVDLLIESVGKATFNRSLNIIRKGGTIVTFGATTDDHVDIDMRHFFYGQFNLLGSTMGSAEEFRDMLDFIDKHDIKPEVDRTFKLDEYEEAFTYLRDTKNFGKIGFEIE
ncbi:zinc-binding dehydrogenase [Tenuibacillus multivorans]|uniref:Zinc-binding alcohol dehydrogenase/oxidoreductase n=1 Tax=Tenuibacillus multivorans TaxID=237069 RepID=A0A1H0EKV6_9BACI|nr:zinc-binding dehydrogenase [Tenuibacillus multivorans]GEL77117.1 alcohol dehydrogenase [Tenuibacillus multivorans]SDN82970.1 zinc-binding alcohol dehydrogenase/oxidoreductase [Tenuibacillus multivorans]